MNINELSDEEIVLELEETVPADPSKNWLKAYNYDIKLKSNKDHVGTIRFRVGYTTSIVRYAGNIGYEVFSEHRGNNYAAKACKLLKDLAREEGMDVIWITCNPDNIASRKTCEKAGATYVETVDLPEDDEQYLKGDRQKCRYRLIIY